MMVKKWNGVRKGRKFLKFRSKSIAVFYSLQAFYKQFQEQNFNSFPFITRVQRENVIYVISLDICLLVLDGTEKPKQAFWPTQYFSAELALRKLESGHHFLFTCNLCFAFPIPEIEVNIFPMPCISF